MFLLALALACTGADKTDDSTTDDSVPADTDPGVGILALTFNIDEDHRAVMEEPCVGSFYGTIWRGDEVTGAGPDDGAVGLEDVFVETVDLTSGGPTTVLYTTGELPGIEVVILGFLDSDANSTEEGRRPDNKDPVTLPNDNDFDVVADTTTEAEVYFGLLNP